MDPHTDVTRTPDIPMPTKKSAKGVSIAGSLTVFTRMSYDAVVSIARVLPLRNDLYLRKLHHFENENRAHRKGRTHSPGEILHPEAHACPTRKHMGTKDCRIHHCATDRSGIHFNNIGFGFCVAGNRIHIAQDQPHRFINCNTYYYNTAIHSFKHTHTRKHQKKSLKHHHHVWRFQF